ncbi:MAG TPA: helix-turn-helix transcriptional regulator [Candidatus Pullichristensenella stercorigallinarum]|uniref:Helix-turn-helix transcriptional regulator n=1 Tax=Candidatus Pullichristensenella stercorigallinarum TaxID=2840909 RepID=A0A9D1CWZ7_9FIRM|nr:helix-turn-helix transcriptional regulator [Candidatus Pullichristensenella stercorigallinarum]
MQAFVEVMSDGSEHVLYNRPGFAVFTRRERMSAFSKGRVLCHWHEDLEFLAVRQGRMRYSVNGEFFEIGEGEGLFINSCHMHSFECLRGADCAFSSLLVHPSVLGANAYLRENFVRPLSRNDAIACLTLNAATGWQETILRDVCAACEIMEGDDPAAELSVMSLAFEAAALLTRHMPAPGPLAMATDRRSLALRQMLGFVQRHYSEKIAIGDIAAAGGLSVSACCDIFRRHTGQTPGGYLTRYRLQKGMEQLQNPNLSVAEVARCVGFASASYFTECFKRYLHTTPLAYRRDAGAERAAGL